MDNNIFGCRVGDALAYVVLYLAVPILISFLSLKTLSTEILDVESMLNVVYCYLSIGLSAANCLYDGMNRFVKKPMPPMLLSNGARNKNTKLFCIIFSTVIIFFYSIGVIFHTLIMKSVFRIDWFLLVYSVPCVIALWDAMETFMQGTIFERTIGGENV